VEKFLAALTVRVLQQVPAPEEIIRKLRTAEDAMTGGKSIEEDCRVIAVRSAVCRR
jgi:hypothetical protein